MSVVPMDLGGDRVWGHLDLSLFFLAQLNLNRSIHQMGTRERVPLLLSPIRSVVSTGIRSRRGHLPPLHTRGLPCIAWFEILLGRARRSAVEIPAFGAFS